MRCPSLSELPPPPAGKTGWPWTEETLPLPDVLPDGSARPRISIVTPSFNQGRFVEETIRSVLLQGYPDLEYHIMDGGSADGSVDTIRRYEPWLSSWVSRKDGGQSQAINQGFLKCTGDVLGWLNSDDCLLPGAFATLMTLRSRNPGCVAWAGATEMFDSVLGTTTILHPCGSTLHELADWNPGVGGFIPQPSCIFDANAFKRVGGIDEKLFCAMDLDLWLRLAQQGGFAVCKDVVSRMQRHLEAKTTAYSATTWVESIVCLHRLGLEREAETLLRRHANHASLRSLKGLSVGEMMKYLKDEDYLLHLSAKTLLKHLVRRAARWLMPRARSPSPNKE